MDLSKFDATAYETKETFDALPAGVYTVTAVKIEQKPTKSGKGEYLEVDLEVIDGEFKGRHVWARFNVKNPSERAQEIGRSQMASFMKCVGKPKVADSAELLNIPVKAKVAVRDEYNDVKGFSPAMGEDDTPF